MRGGRKTYEVGGRGRQLDRCECTPDVPLLLVNLILATELERWKGHPDRERGRFGE